MKTEKKKRSEKYSNSESPSAEYRVGPGRPPLEHRFKKGQSGNPTGRKKSTNTLDLKAQLEHALRKKITVTRGGREERITMGAAGVEQLVAQYARGDRYARRDVIVLAREHGVDLTAGHREAIASALGAPLSATDEVLVEDFFRRRLADEEQRENNGDPSASHCDDLQAQIKTEE